MVVQIQSVIAQRAIALVAASTMAARLEQLSLRSMVNKLENAPVSAAR